MLFSSLTLANERLRGWVCLLIVSRQIPALGSPPPSFKSSSKKVGPLSYYAG